VEDLKGRGFLETSSNNEAGVAHALRQYVLNGAVGQAGVESADV
jgi:hypothetical protein